MIEFGLIPKIAESFGEVINVVILMVQRVDNILIKRRRKENIYHHDVKSMTNLSYN